jgi:uncharacterized protein YigE (DUF2233 family)
MKKVFIISILSGIIATVLIFAVSAKTWKKLDKGLFFFNFRGKYQIYDFDIYILKIDPAYYSLKLLMSSKLKQGPMTLKKWANEYKLIAAINASMFWEDQSTSTGYMKDKKFINQHLIHKKYGGFLVFNPKNPKLPYVTIIEKKEEYNWKKLIKSYETVIQNFRMIGKDGKNLWHKDSNAYSVSAVGIDKQNNILFIFSLNPLPIHDLNEILLNLPINISSCLFTEGGSTSGIYIKVDGFEKYFCGHSHMDIFSTTPTRSKIPNVIGVIKKLKEGRQ